MLSHVTAWSRYAASLAFAAFFASQAVAQEPETQLAETITRIEQRLEARVGVAIRDSGSDWSFGHREDEPFPMNSTFKSMLCGAVLERVDNGTLTLDERLQITQEDILEYAPVTETKVGETMTIGELCHAALDMSDNTATNLLIDRLGAPRDVTDFLRAIGDPVSRLDRHEPEMNTYAPGDLRDTTTPAAMATTLATMLLGDALTPESRAQLNDWMSEGGVTGALLRASAPADWHIADRSGSGNSNRSVVAMITPPDRAPYFVSIYLSEAFVDFETRNAAVIELSTVVMDVLTSR